MAANKKKRSLLKWVCFLAYLLFLGYLLFYSAGFDRVEHEDYRYNLVLFQEIGRYYYYGIRSGNWNLFILNVIGNIVVFMPIGMFLPSLFFRCKNIFFTTILSLELSLCVELVQLITKVGSFDVDDLLLNTLGGVCGFIVYSIYRGIKHLVSEK
ncbi:MAG: VanZ family protein [Agathobacter sp.]|nr:VanZ family protein [Agathobacter sp.]